MLKTGAQLSGGRPLMRCAAPLRMQRRKGATAFFERVQLRWRSGPSHAAYSTNLKIVQETFCQADLKTISIFVSLAKIAHRKLSVPIAGTAVGLVTTQRGSFFHWSFEEHARHRFALKFPHWDDGGDKFPSVIAHVVERKPLLNCRQVHHPVISELRHHIFPFHGLTFLPCASVLVHRE